ncbi:hypothetical protein OKW38_005800 [Paraburkholderia sp. MM5496-R1]
MDVQRSKSDPTHQGYQPVSTRIGPGLGGAFHSSAKQNHRSRAEACSDRAPPRPSIGDITDELDVGQHEAVRTHPAQFNILQRRQRLRICRAGLLEARHLAGALVLRGLFVINGYVAAHRLGSFDIAFMPVFAALAHRCGKYSHGLRKGYQDQEFSARGQREPFQRLYRVTRRSPIIVTALRRAISR